MRRAFVVVVVVSLVVSGCGEKKAASSKEAIETSKYMETLGEQKDYLMKQARAFYRSDDVQGAFEIAQYVVEQVDKNCHEAHRLIEEIGTQWKSFGEEIGSEWKSFGEEVADDFKKRFGDFGE